MTRFLKQVRNGDVAWPTQRRYAQDAWQSAFERKGDGSPEDRSLYESGVVVHEHLQHIREAITTPPLSARTTGRLYCAIANRSFWWIKRRLDSRISEALDSTGVVNFDAIDEQLFRDCYGNPASTDASIELVVDGVTLPLRLALDQAPVNDAYPGELDVIKQLTGHVRLGQTYFEIESLWQKCVWEGYCIERTERADIYIPPEKQWVIANAVGQFRHTNLERQDAMTLVSQLSDLPRSDWRRLQRKKDLKAVGKTSPLRITTKSLKQRGVDSILDDPTLVGRKVALDLYMEPLLEQPLQGLSGLSVDNLLEVWSLLQSLATHLQSQFEHSNPIMTIEEMLEFAPTISKPSLEAAVARATDLSASLACRAVKLLTFTGDRDDVLWLQPLVRTSPEEFTVVTAPFLCIHVLWLIEQLLAKGKADLEVRGPEFEASVRGQVGEYARDGQLDAGVFPHDIEFRGNPVKPGQPQEEQIDLLLRVGSVVLVGEVKCQLFPNTSAPRRHNYRNTLEKAAEQAKRKSSFAEKNTDQLLEFVEWADHIDAASLSFYPVVITNVVSALALRLRECRSSTFAS